MKKKIISIAACIALLFILVYLNGFPLVECLKITGVIVVAFAAAIFVSLTGMGARYKDDGLEDYPDW